MSCPHCASSLCLSFSQLPRTTGTLSLLMNLLKAFCRRKEGREGLATLSCKYFPTSRGDNMGTWHVRNTPAVSSFNKQSNKLVSFCHTMHKCVELTRLLRLIYTQSGRCAPQPISILLPAGEFNDIHISM